MREYKLLVYVTIQFFILQCSTLNSHALDPYGILTANDRQLAVEDSKFREDPEPYDGHNLFEWVCFETKYLKDLHYFYTDASTILNGYEYTLSFEIHFRDKNTCHYFAEDSRSRNRTISTLAKLKRVLYQAPALCIYTTYDYQVRPEGYCKNFSAWYLHKVKTINGEVDIHTKSSMYRKPKRIFDRVNPLFYSN